MEEEIQYRNYKSTEISAKRDEVIDFLLNLTVERKTLLTVDEIDEKKYPEICTVIASGIKFLVLAYHGDKIIGMTATSKTGTGLLAKRSPFVRGFIVVKSEYQKKGIGQKLQKIQINYLKKWWSFWVSIVKIENERQLHINKKSGFIILGKDDRFFYGFRPTRDELKIFNPLVYIYLRLKYIEKHRIKKMLKCARARIKSSIVFRI